MAVLFVTLFVGLVCAGPELAPALAVPIWALLIAVALTVPALAPWLAASVLPRIHSIEISEVEIALQEAGAPIVVVPLAMQNLGLILLQSHSGQK